MTRPDGLGHGGLNVKPVRIDLDALHRLLYRRADRLGRLKLDVKRLAGELELNYGNLTKVVNRMVAEGRLDTIGGARTTTKTFVVRDPESYA